MTDQHRQAAADAIFKLLAQCNKIRTYKRFRTIEIPQEGLERILEILDHSTVVWRIDNNIIDDDDIDIPETLQLPLW